MRESLRSALAWQALALVCYFAGVTLFVLGAVGPFLAPPERSLANLTTVDLLLVVASLVLFATGGTASAKSGWRNSLPAGSPWGTQPERSSRGEPSYGADREADREPPTAYEDGELYVRCPECGAKNETTYSYCGECSSELPRL
ncbi:hypothetical protein HLRTI_002596 [Halorhabdus tiamatea SARL4B]|uniref:DUF7577 domain-containing protein n=1 Tax=Halorhabdus tiamatea SARL4B TaxID=1033806 RepID=F7PIV0_9EURY|nr:hypothetical protein [Halorhabdus tiamatea]ERJ05441.1 hypothetical protein HLRTI_002596 [Halorhabdus tiamatea SARL4B]CCQ33333.1 hypothetical protein HTIA_1197 [Halorhabdus tiamatea SARL4B]